MATSVAAGHVSEGYDKIYQEGRVLPDGITGQARLKLKGTPGNDMAAFMNGLELFVEGNTQDSIGNTNDGKIRVHGSAGDTVGYAMRGGEIYIREWGIPGRNSCDLLRDGDTWRSYVYLKGSGRL